MEVIDRIDVGATASRTVPAGLANCVMVHSNHGAFGEMDQEIRWYKGPPSCDHGALELHGFWQGFLGGSDLGHSESVDLRPIIIPDKWWRESIPDDHGARVSDRRSHH
jgi:hypothetical protein